MIANSVPAGRVYRAPDMLSDPHFSARDAIVSVPHARHGSIRMQGCFPKLSDTPSSISHAAPAAPGIDNADIYGERLGLNARQLADLASRQIV